MKNDPERAAQIITTPGIWDWLGTGKPEDFSPSSHVDWLVSTDGLACFPVHQDRGRVWEIHAAVLPGGRANSTRYAHEAIAWVRDHTDATWLIGKIASNNQRAKSLARLCGFKEVMRFANGGHDSGLVVYGLEF